MVSIMPGLLFIFLSFVSLVPVLGTGLPRKQLQQRAEYQVTGKITDANTGAPLTGASITVKGGKSTTSDENGNYSITVSNETAVLVFTFVGYTSQSITVKGKTTLNVSLKPANADLTQVVVVGYGTQNKKDITGSVKSL